MIPDQNHKTLEVETRREWRAWLEEHHASEPEVWLVFRKTGQPASSLDYEAAVEEALCFGWVDSLIRRLDDQRYARKFTPRQPGSKWSSLPPYFEEALKANTAAWANFNRLPPSHRRAYLAWVDSAKREETKAKRLAEAIARLETGQKPGLK